MENESGWRSRKVVEVMGNQRGKRRRNIYMLNVWRFWFPLYVAVVFGLSVSTSKQRQSLIVAISYDFQLPITIRVFTSSCGKVTNPMGARGLAGQLCRATRNDRQCSSLCSCYTGGHQNCQNRSLFMSISTVVTICHLHLHLQWLFWQ